MRIESPIRELISKTSPRFGRINQPRTLIEGRNYKNLRSHGDYLNIFFFQKKGTNGRRGRLGVDDGAGRGLKIADVANYRPRGAPDEVFILTFVLAQITA